MPTSKDIRSVMTLPMVRAALRALPGLHVDEADDRFADALARLDKAEAPRRASIWDENIRTSPGAPKKQSR